MNDICLSLAECALEAQHPDYNSMILNMKEFNVPPVVSNNSSSTNSSTRGGTGSGMHSSNKHHDHDIIIYASKVKCLRGIAYLNQGEYYLAAISFLSIKQSTFTNQLNSVISAEDIALYGALLGLITLDRTAIASMIETETWRERLELYPTLMESIQCYMKAEYGKCLQLVQLVKPAVEMDLFLSKHVNALWKLLREKCIVQYFQPYLSVSLVSMKESFGFDSVDEVEDLVASLIESNRITGAKIHGVNRTLTCMNAKGLERRRRKMLISKAGKVGKGLMDEVESMILRMSCLEKDLVVATDHDNNRSSRSGGSSTSRGLGRVIRGGDSMAEMDCVVYSSDEEEMY